jgi:hypothetical protein
MTEQQAERVADIVLGLAAAGAAYYILKTPRLRRIAWGLLRTAIVGSGPAWLIAETMRGWEAGAARAPQQPGI